MARPASLSLFPEELPPRRDEAPVAQPRALAKQLWLAVHFLHLSLEALRIAPMDGEPAAIMEGVGAKSYVWDCTAGAKRHGVQRGQLLTTALVLVPTLKTVERDTAAEQAALIRLAALGHNFTPTVSLEAGSLLLEVEGSAHLFGGPFGVMLKARQAFHAEGFDAGVALAPTPVAALWLAQADLSISVTGREELRSVLGKLPVHALPWRHETNDAFSRLGLKHMADVFRLPRDGLAKRFGKDFVQTLDRAVGRLPDPRTSWQEAKRCRFERELPGEFIQMDHMRPYVEGMVDDLTRELLAHDAAVNRLKLVYKHWHQPATSIVVGSAIPYRQAGRWLELIHGRLANLTLPAPVHEIQLFSGRFMPYRAINLDLLGGKPETQDSLQRLTDLLRSRLGQKAVFGVTTTSDARPEQAWRNAEPGTEVADGHTPQTRPIHVLPAPVLLDVGSKGPRHQGATLTLIEGPERIEGGWWANESWTRDYYEAISTRGERLWIYRQDKQWFLHGFFS
ncbi:MAG TPA: DNA polymerase Y family protein [Gammaproteobacteria bacterium]|jgi:protein ImuB|nr:DNA polymerase Y family protein [Gammaproteobacteria bacterium]